MVQHSIPDVRIVNRTDQHADELASQIGGTAYLWEQRWTQLAEVDAVIIATSAAEPILKLCDLQFLLEIRKGRPLTIIDISVPRAVEVGRCELPTLTYIDIDDLHDVVDEHLSQRQACIPQVQGIISQEVETFIRWLASRQVVPIIKGLRQKVQHVVQDELDDVLTRLDHLDDHDKATLQRFANRVINKVLHDPTTNLRLNASKSNVIDYTQIVSDLFALKGVD
jgi:glutamyl-tRNA reductase